MAKHYLMILIPALLAAPGMAQEIPECAGKETTLQVCGNCHEPEVLLKHRQGRDEWVATMQKMIEAGAEGTPEQFKEVLEYLAKNLAPKVNVNKLSAVELEVSLGLTAKEAAAIVKYRTDHGAFQTVDDLKKVPDLDFKKIEAQKARLVF